MTLRIAVRVLVCASIALVLSAAASAAPILPSLIGDHMVLQQGREIHIWGWADPGEKITVSLGDQKASVTTDAQRRWSVFLPAMTAGGPFTLTVQGKKSIVLRDVLLGEIWVASGQSNMTYALSGATGGGEEVKKADYPQIRLFTVPKKIAMTPQADISTSSWQICTPETAKDFSAVAYTFARDLHRKLGVPVGIVVSAWPGTPIEEWMPAPAFQADADLQTVVTKWNSEKPGVKRYAEEPLAFNLEFKGFELLRADSQAGTPVAFSSFYEKATGTTVSLNWAYDWASAPETYFELDRRGTTSTVRVHGKLDNTAASMLTGRWRPDGSPTDLSGYAGIRVWVRGDGQFRLRFLQPTITDVDDYGSKYFSASPEWQPVTVWFRDLHQEGWGVVKELTPQAFTSIVIESVTKLGYPNRPPSGLFNGMIAPLLPMPIRGALWYQGESNALSAQLYRKELPAMIAGWRDGWNQKDLAFLIVQLPNHGAIPENPTESAWAELREAQLKTVQAVPNTGLAVTIDLGEPKNVHPPRKLEVGERLAVSAMANTYKEPVVYSGPIFESAKAELGHIRLHFRNTGSAIMARDGAALQGFAVAGSDRHFHWAEANIEGDEVVVSSQDVPEPVAVRYAWGDSPVCNLINKDGFPASPFRTDDWPGITAATVNVR